MNYSIHPITEQDRQAVIDIFNYYIENSFAAYPENKFPYEAFDMLMQMSIGYPTATVKNEQNKVVGFGFLRAHNEIPTFSQTAEITYFLDHEHTGKGLGMDLLDYLSDESKKKGITNILAHISSLNPRSIAFHKKNGFKKCGKFEKIGMKNGKAFDVIWMQKTL